jgi:hypothetical protein
MDATRADPEFLVDVVRTALSGRRAHDQHPRHGRLCAPDQVIGAVRRLFERVPEIADAVVSFTARTISASPPRTRSRRSALARARSSSP